MATAPKTQPSTAAAPAASDPQTGTAPTPEAAPASAPDTTLTNVIKVLAVPEPTSDALAAMRLAEINRMLAATPAPSAVALIEDARISGSPLHLVAAKIAADEAARVADEAAKALLPPVAGVATLTGAAGIAGSLNGALRPDQAPVVDPNAIQVGPGSPGFSKKLAVAEAAGEEETVKMSFPRKIHLTLQNYTTIVFEPGINLVPLSLSAHPYLGQCGATIVAPPEARVLPEIQVGTAAKTAPVVK